ncbi:(Fe-S)-binding protein [Caldilinea sp.]|uniref:(Fe-S)-binding protein n=1 Tax=Caldilinea sp. TaxID=2293560 RepID=UPI0021DDF15C|nr:(Fe-S)-binding protein [Caldilinea sp.]GIV67340.1 MAG: glycolate oxidase iron-sulfur subunit [Caldilinea sp.]
MGDMTAIELLNQTNFRRRLDQCIHCGLCLPACPTYAVDQREADSPRGRIALMRAAAEGRIGLEGAFEEHIELCLGCRACETACPSGVQYGLLLETARAALAQEKARTRRAQLADLVQRIGLRSLLPHRRRLRWLARGVWLYQRLGLARLAQWALPHLPPALTTMEGMTPPVNLNFLDLSQPAPALGPRQGKVAFFVGCVQDAFLAGVNRATVRVLQRNGYEVHFPQAQTCCNAAALHSGDVEFARALARRNIDAFADGDFAAILNNAGGCGAALKGYDHLLADDPLYADRARSFVAKVKDIHEFLADHLHHPPTGHIQARVVYVDSCHLRHGQKVVGPPRALLRAIPGVELVELQQPDMCCGSAGVYNLLQPEMANQVLDAKLADVRSAHANIIATANTGCYLQMIYGVKRAGLNATVMHVVELLERSYTNNADAQLHKCLVGW